MIVYTGKQFGNNFNNGDEGLFQDANRPRDDNKFKLRPGLQSEKWDFRNSNKNINVEAAELIATGNASSVASAYTVPDSCTISKLSETAKFGDPGCFVNKDGNVEIAEDGTYVLQAFTQFLFPSTPSSGYFYIEEVALLKHKMGNYTGFPRNVYTLNQGRVCGSGDQLLAWTVGRFTQGAVFNVGAIHTYGSPISMYQVLNVQRLK